MDAYHALAASYDRLTQDVDYEKIVAFYQTILKKEGLRPRTAADLACGTGSVALLLADSGLQVVGVDMSEDMLTVASQRAQERLRRPVFVRQKLQQLQLPVGVDLAVCALDGLNYILDPAECRQALCRIYRALNPGGIFIFDVNTPEKLQTMDGQTFLDEDDDVYCVWRGEFDRDTNICTYGMDLFQRQGELWQRSGEMHQEYAYSVENWKEYLKGAGFCRIQCYADGRLEPPGAGEQRIYFSARKGYRK